MSYANELAELQATIARQAQQIAALKLNLALSTESAVSLAETADETIARLTEENELLKGDVLNFSARMTKADIHCAGLRAELGECKGEYDMAANKVDALRDQLADRDALLRELDDAWNAHDGKERFGKLMGKVEALAAEILDKVKELNQ